MATQHRPTDDANTDPDADAGGNVTMFRHSTAAAQPFDEARYDPFAGLPPLLRAMRPLQWTKNLLVFGALIFTRSVFDLDPLLKSIGAFLAFCAVSSAIYLLNDVRDVEQDRLHPAKRFRPVATGELAARLALGAAGVLAFAGLAVAAVVSIELMLLLGLYLCMMGVYNAGLKRIMLVDVIVISLGFVLRAAAGAVAISVPISPWLYMCTLVLALLIGFGKRRHELVTLQDAASAHRQNLDAYTVTLLDQIIAVAAGATIVAYSIYTVESPTLPANHAMMLTIPIVVYAVFRYLYLLYIKRAGGSPEVLLVRDRGLLLAVGTWVIVSGAILYWA